MASILDTLEMGVIAPSPSNFHLLQIINFNIYDMLPRWRPFHPNPMFMSNITRNINTIAWHSKFQTVYPHTLAYRMMLAISTNDLKQIQTILEDPQFNVDIPIDRKYQLNALQFASMTNRYGIMQLLLLYGANINKQDRFGNTPLMLAVKQHNLEAINTLMKNGCDRNIKNKYGLTPLMRIKDNVLEYKTITNFIESYPETPRRFPKFTVDLNIQKYVKHPMWDFIKQYKILNGKTKIYPFNNLQGIYRVDITSYQTVEQIANNSQSNKIQ